MAKQRQTTGSSMFGPGVPRYPTAPPSPFRFVPVPNGDLDPNPDGLTAMRHVGWEYDEELLRSGRGFVVMEIAAGGRSERRFAPERLLSGLFSNNQERWLQAAVVALGADDRCMKESRNPAMYLIELLHEKAGDDATLLAFGARVLGVEPSYARYTAGRAVMHGQSELNLRLWAIRAA